MGTTNNLICLFQEKKMAKKKHAVSDDNIVIHVVEQMYDFDWFTDEQRQK